MKRRDEVLVGIVATAALALAIVGSLFLARGGLLPGYKLHAVFPWGAGLRQGQPVMLSGVTVGYVDAVDIRRDGKLLVTMRIYKQYQVPKGTSSKVAPNGVFGDMMVAMTPTEATDDMYVVGDTIPAGSPSIGIGEVLAKVDSISGDVRALTSALRGELVDRGGLTDIRKTVSAANELISTLQQIAETQSRELTKTQESMRRVANAIDSARVDSTFRSVGDLTKNVSELTNDLRGTTQQLSGILAKLDSKQGSAGMLLNDDGMYRDVRSLLQRLDSLTLDFQKNPRKYINLSIF
ncbi:MAG: MCE family protein [Gemmatimonadaceae bacterium]|nr:MCE family protein [Gemmatimonadaceae bacterium]